MPKYEVVERSFIDGRVFMPGDKIDFDGVPARNLKPLDEKGKAAQGKLKETVAKDAKRLAVVADGGEPDDAA